YAHTMPLERQGQAARYYAGVFTRCRPGRAVATAVPSKKGGQPVTNVDGDGAHGASRTGCRALSGGECQLPPGPRHRNLRKSRSYSYPG
ncbi:hypothetical protein K0M31_012992, partial [Melipona bicolor]